MHVGEAIGRPQAVRYDSTKFSWIGNMEGTTGSIFTWHTSPTKTIEIARKRRAPMGASGKSSILYQMMTLSNQLLGTKFDIVLGYNGAERVQAVERGEVEGSFSNLENFAGLAPHWIADGLTSKLNILVVNAKERVPQLPNVPTMIELAQTDVHKQMFSFMMLQSSTGRAVFTTQDVPADRVNALRRSFDQTMKDKGFQADLKRAHIELKPSTGEEVQAAVAELIGTRPAVVEEIKKAFK